jgi:trehalose utilization protein
MNTKIRVTIWNEYIHERENAAVKKIYPEGIHQIVSTALANQLGDAVQIRTATLDEPEHGLSEKILAETDVPGGDTPLTIVLPMQLSIAFKAEC